MLILRIKMDKAIGEILLRVTIFFMLSPNPYWSSNCSQCNDPVSEGTAHVIEFNVSEFKRQPFRISSSTHGFIASCLPDGTCTNLVNMYHTSLTVRKDWSFVAVKIYNVSRYGLKSDQRASFTAGGNLKCIPAIFSKPQSLNCKLSAQRMGLYVNCTSRKVFPQGACFFSTNFVWDSHMMSIVNSVYEKNNTSYYQVTCSLHLPLADITTGTHVVNATVYPIVTGRPSDVYLYGINSSNVYEIEEPRVDIPDCPNTITEGKNINCVCKRVDKSVIETSVRWYDKDTHTFVSDDVLSVVANRIHPVYYCKANNSLGWESSPKNYRPLINVDSVVVSVITSFVSISILAALLIVLLKFLKGRFQWEFPRSSTGLPTANLNIELKRKEESCDDGYIEIIDGKCEHGLNKTGKYDCLNEYHLYEKLEDLEDKSSLTGAATYKN